MDAQNIVEILQLNEVQETEFASDYYKSMDLLINSGAYEAGVFQRILSGKEPLFLHCIYGFDDDGPSLLKFKIMDEKEYWQAYAKEFNYN